MMLDVLALASALNRLTLDLRTARTGLWSALQLSSRDLPARNVNLARAMATDHLGVEQKQDQFATAESIWPQQQTSALASGARHADYLSSFAEELDNDVFTDPDDDDDELEQLNSFFP